MSDQRGVTLLELLVGVAILAILAAIAAPSMHDWLIRQRVKAAANELITDIQLARTESVTRNKVIRISFDTSSDVTCYTIHTGDNDRRPKCDCTAAVGTACNGKGMTEIKTTSVDVSSEVKISSDAESGIQEYKGNGLIDMTSPPMNVAISGGGTRQLLVTTSSLIRRPSICVPSGSTIAGYPPCP